jgi:hypothetical protein
MGVTGGIALAKAALSLGLKIYSKKPLLDAVLNSGELSQEDMDEITEARKEIEDKLDSLA